MCHILGIPESAVNNYTPVPLPQMVGAGRVKAFREGAVSCVLCGILHANHGKERPETPLSHPAKAD